MKTTAVVASIVFASMSLFGTSTFAQNEGVFGLAAQFSATSSMVMNGRTISMKIARSGNKIRTGMPGPNANAYMLLLLDQHKSYMVMGPNMCMEMPVAGAMTSNPVAASSQGKVDVKVIGAGTMNGHPVKIEDVTITPSNGGQPVTMKVWAATDLKDFPVRTEMQTPKGVVTTNYTDISLAAPPDSLFDVPNNCRQMPTMPGASQR
jgi:hypothetical protein